MRDRLIELMLETNDKFADVDCTDEEAMVILADYLLANGVIVLPCKVGDVIYKPIITDDTKEPVVWTIVVTDIDIDINKHGVSPSSFVVGKLINTECGVSFDFLDIGKTVFLTKEEAEQALVNYESSKSEK